MEQEEWFEQDPQELPRRPRRRLLAPIPVTLLGVLLTACGFIGGVLIEKGQQSPSSGGSRGAAAVAFRGAGIAAGAGGGRPGGLGGARGSAAGAGGLGGEAARITVGQVANIDRGTLYVTSGQGNTVKVEVPSGLKVSRTVSTSPHNIHPGETVIVQGNQNGDGSVDARSISIGAANPAGGLAALFGRAGRAGGARAGAGAGEAGAPSGSGGAAGRGGEGGSGGGGEGNGPVLFGPGKG